MVMTIGLPLRPSRSRNFRGLKFRHQGLAGRDRVSDHDVQDWTFITTTLLHKTKGAYIAASALLKSEKPTKIHTQKK